MRVNKINTSSGTNISRKLIITTMSFKTEYTLKSTFIKLILPVLISFGFIMPVSAFQKDKESGIRLSVGVGKSNITPDPNVKNWVTGKPYQEINDSLYVKTLVLNDGQKNVVLVAWDLVDSGESATEEVRKAISAELNIPMDNIIVTATHNHSAPWSPVYEKGHRGKELDTWWAIRYMPAQNDDVYFKNWMVSLIEKTVKSARQAYDSLQPATMWIGRADISDYIQNRRPQLPDWGVEDPNIPEAYNYFHQDWNPKILVGGASFGPLDRTMTLVSFRNSSGNNIVSLFHLAAHAVSIYPFSDAVSGDWPAEAAGRIGEVLGGEAMFLQGTAGDVNPWRRGTEAVEEMGGGLANYAGEAYKYSARLKHDTLAVRRGTVQLPIDKKGKDRTGLESVKAEVQVMALGSFAIVTLPGEPLTELGTAIRENSPFPQTLVLGYSNGNGVHYVGMPGEKAKGGYEMEGGTIGTDEAGKLLVELAGSLLNEIKPINK